MIQKSTVAFLKGLKKNNTKEWFDDHRKEYDLAKTNFLDFMDQLIPAIALFDPEITGIKAKDCVYRINRDIRFSKDKTPYKSHFGAAISLKGRKSTYPGYYIHLEPGNIMVGGGAYMLMPEELQKVRQEIDYNAKEFLKIANDKIFRNIYGEIKGEALVNPPKGYESDNAAINFIKNKQWYAMSAIADTDVLSMELEKKTLNAYKALLPLNRFLQKAMTH